MAPSCRFVCSWPCLFVFRVLLFAYLFSVGSGGGVDVEDGLQCIAAHLAAAREFCCEERLFTPA
eukprot:337822-Rhodomonas_salina.4